MEFTAKGIFPSSRASRYLQQLCKHFSHKLDVSFTPTDGTINFPFGRCDLAAGDDTLTLTATAADVESLERTESVIGSHLERFAFREEVNITWERAGD